MHQPARFITPTFCREVYLARMFDFYLFLSVSFACMLGPCGPQKRHHFVRTSFSAISLRFSQLPLGGNPSFLKGSGLNDMFGLSFCNVESK